MPQARKGVWGKDGTSFSPPQHGETRSASSTPFWAGKSVRSSFQMGVLIKRGTCMYFLSQRDASGFDDRSDVVQEGSSFFVWSELENHGENNRAALRIRIALENFAAFDER